MPSSSSAAPAAPSRGRKIATVPGTPSFLPDIQELCTLTFHNAHPVIFDQESSSPMGGLGLLAGALTNNKGIGGTLRSGSHHHGKTRLIIYGAPKTGKPSSWVLLEWLPNGKKVPETNTELYDWKLAPNARAALAKDGFYESYRKFVNGPDSDDDGGKK